MYRLEDVHSVINEMVSNGIIVETDKSAILEPLLVIDAQRGEAKAADELRKVY